MKTSNGFLSTTLAVAGVMASVAIQAADLCATEQETEQVRAFFDQNPGAVPFSAARRLGLAEAKVAAALPAEQAVSAPGSAFAEVWAALSEISQATFLITKGSSVFEVMSGVSPGAPSTRSRYFNIEYEEPLRGHLRPDEYAAIYAVDLGSRRGRGPGASRPVLRRGGRARIRRVRFRRSAGCHARERGALCRGQSAASRQAFGMRGAGGGRGVAQNAPRSGLSASPDPLPFGKRLADP